MKGIIIAAGKGVRLQPFTYTRPKPLIPVLGKPLIYWDVKALSKAGIKDLVIVVSYKGDEIKEALNKLLVSENINIRYIEQGKELGTADAVEKALKDASINEDFILVYGDIMFDPSIMSRLLRIPDNTNAVVSVLLDNPQDYGLIKVKPDGSLAKIIEKPAEAKTPAPIFSGIGKFNPDILLEYLEKTGVSPRGEREFTDTLTLMSKDYSIKVLNIASKDWIELGKPWNIIDVNKWLLNRLETRIEGEIEDNVVMKGEPPIIVEEGAIVKSGTYIVGPVFIGRNAQVGPHAYLRSYSVINEGARIGFSVEVKESVIMEHAHASHLAYIGDSVIGEYANIGAGTITANLRFDNKTVKVYIKGERVDSSRRKVGAFIGAFVRTGINVSIFPGVKIGAFSWIYPGCIVNRDIPPNTILKCTQKIEESELKKG